MPKPSAAMKRQKEIEVAEANWRSYQRARNAGHEEYVRDGIKFNKFYLGDQWSEADEANLDAEGRPHLTINLVLKTVNAFLAEQKKQRADLEFRPRRDATSEMGVLMSKIVEQILDNNDYEYVEREVFSDGIIQDRGYFDIRIDFEDNIYGDISITADDPFETMPDPDSKSYDPKDWNEVIRTRWMTLEEIEANYGKEKRKQLESVAMAGEYNLNTENIRFDGSRTFGSEDDYNPIPEGQGYAAEDQDATIRCIRIVERQWRKLTTRRCFVDPLIGDSSFVPDEMDDTKARKLAKETGVEIIEKSAKRIRWTVSALNVALHDEWSPYRSFTVVPYFPYFRKGKASGIVRQLVSPQEQHNKYESQMLHVVNTSANSGWVFEAGSLIGMTKDELEQRGSETGLVLEYGAGKEAPQKIQPNQIPSGLERIAERTKQSLNEIAGIDPSVGGTQEQKVNNNEVGSRETDLVQIQVPFDTLNLSRKYVARKVLELVQDFMTEPRIMRVTNWEDMGRPVEELQVNYIDDAGALINNLTIGEYDISVATKPARDTYMASQYAEAMEMKMAGVVIPDEVIIRNSTLENKLQVATQVAELTGTAPPSEEEIQLAQMMQQIQIAGAQAEVQKIQAEVMELQARAQEQYMKAQFLQGQEQREAIELGAKFRKDMADLNVKMQMQLNDLTNKLELAKIHTGNKRDVAMLEAATKGAMDEIRNRTTLDAARIGASSRAKPVN